MLREAGFDVLVVKPTDPPIMEGKYPDMYIIDEMMEVDATALKACILEAEARYAPQLIVSDKTRRSKGDKHRNRKDRWS